MEFWKEVRQLVLTGQLTQRAVCLQYRLGWRTLKKILPQQSPRSVEREGDPVDCRPNGETIRSRRHRPTCERETPRCSKVS